MRLIDADALIDTFKEQQKMKWNQCASPSSWSDAYDDFIDALIMSETDEGHTPPEVMEKMIVAVFAAKAEKAEKRKED